MPKAGPSLSGEQAVVAPEEATLVRKHLKEVLSSPVFAGSHRTQDFLRFVVTHALAGDLDSLRERMIGAELFGRPVSYDTGSDSVVRVRASELRKKLALYYGNLQDGPPEVRIELPSGSYVPRFHFASAQGDPQGDSVPDAVWEPEAKSSHESSPLSTEANSVPLLPASRRRGGPWFLPLLAGCSVLVLCIAGYAGFQKWQTMKARSGIRSIAILPLENLSGVAAQDYFADGVTEELINDLGQVSTLRVISLTSSMSYKGTKKKLPEIARELNVDAIIEGGVLREGNDVRISAQLIDAKTDRPIWARTYVRDLTNVLVWQGEVSQDIAEEIRIEVTPQEQARLARKPQLDPEAQDFYLRGISLRDRGDCENAIPLLQQAIQKDPNYAGAHSALASCYGLLGESGRSSYEEAFAHQKAEALKAITLDESDSEAHAELANTAMTLDWDWATAQAQFRRALEISPNSATDHEKYAFYLVRTGHPSEALAEIERSVDLDPVSGSTFHSEGFIYYFTRHYDQALALTRTVQGLKINLRDWSFLLGAIYAEKGMYADSIAAFLKSGDGPYTLGHLGNAYARAGQMDAAQKTIARLQQHIGQEGVGRYEIALIYAGLGQKDEAFRWLEQAYRAHDVGLVYLKIDPCLDPVRSDPRFSDLMRSVGLTP